MRVTNAMTTNQLLLDLNRNLNALNYLEYQARTGNKIRYASDDPIIAARALKFRTNITETDQYLANADQGRAWLESTANPVKNIMEALINGGENSIRSLLVSGSNGTKTINDSKIYANQLKETLNEILGELNTSYAGRYLFSGLKTDQKAVIDTAMPNMYMRITEKISVSEINENYEDFTQASLLDMPEATKSIRLKLAYDGLETVGVSILDSNGDPVSPTAAYNFTISEKTGEIIMDQATYDDLKLNSYSLSVTYRKKGFKENDLNPISNFECTELLEDISNPGTYINGKSYTQKNQQMEYEMGIGIRMQINSIGKEVVPIGLINDIRDAIEFAERITISDKEDLIGKFVNEGFSSDEAVVKAEEQIANEQKFYQDMVTTKYTQLIGKLDKHADAISMENTSIGARLNRLDLIENRLLDDRINFEELKTNNENVDITETYIRYQSMYTVYQSALQMGAKLVQMTLVNFI